METCRNRIIIKRVFIQLSLLFLMSCSSPTDEIKEQVAEQMERYIYDNYEDSYDYRAIETIYEYTDSLTWEEDLYRIQHLFYYAKNRRAIVTNSYADINEVYNNSSTYLIYGDQTLYYPLSIFDYPYVDAKKVKGLSKRLRESYVTKEEKEVCDYYFYRSSVPTFREKIEELENTKFNGWRIYHCCQFRKESGAIVQKQFVLYHDENRDWSYYSVHPYELNYNYPMFRNYIKNVLSIDLESKDVQDLIKKYSVKDNKGLWGIHSENKLQRIFDNAISRFSLN